jgi:hypothetical protein
MAEVSSFAARDAACFQGLRVPWVWGRVFADVAGVKQSAVYSWRVPDVVSAAGVGIAGGRQSSGAV